MTEVEWLACRDPFPMLKFLLDTRRQAETWRGRLRAWFRGRRPLLVSDRKLRLFICGCCRLHWDIFDRETDQQIVEEAEQLAERGGGGQVLEGLAQTALRYGPSDR